jgi:hypothetical protein
MTALVAPHAKFRREPDLPPAAIFQSRAVSLWFGSACSSLPALLVIPVSHVVLRDADRTI